MTNLEKEGFKMITLEELSPEVVEELWEKWGTRHIPDHENVYDYLQDFLRAYLCRVEADTNYEIIFGH